MALASIFRLKMVRNAPGGGLLPVNVREFSHKKAFGKNELLRGKLRGINCHAEHDPASSLYFWIPASGGMTTRGRPRGIGLEAD